MVKSKIEEQIIIANNSRLRIISLIALGFSVYILITDFLFQGVVQDGHLNLYKILDIAFACISVSAISFFWLIKNKSTFLQKSGIILYPFLFIIWSAIITGIGFSTLGFSTFIVVVLLTAFFLYLNLAVSIVYFVGSGLALIVTLNFMGAAMEDYLPIMLTLIPIVLISIVVSLRIYKFKITDLLSQEKMADLNQKLYDSIGNLEEEVEKRTNEIMEALIKAEESERLKSAFLANMSHEIRTPMNGIIGFTQLLKEPDLSGEEQQEFIKTIELSGERMLNTINNIVDFSKIESGMMIADLKESDINKQNEFIYNLFKPEIEGKGMQFLFKNGLPSNKAVIKTDGEKVYAILTNLIKNAIKYTDKGSIEFGYEKKGEYLEFFVKDTGPGIPLNLQQKIFDRFIQVNDNLNRLYEGSGLGLSIAESYVEILEGRIWVESEEGKGSIFYFTIPYNAVSKEITEIKEAKPVEYKEVQIKKLKILIAEDDEASFSFLNLILKNVSTKIIHAKSGVEALVAFRANPDLDLVLMDIRMPEMDGLEATRQIRQLNKEVVIIAQTAYAFSGDIEKALEAGCNDYISKPINKTLLHESIKKHCNS